MLPEQVAYIYSIKQLVESNAWKEYWNHESWRPNTEIMNHEGQIKIISGLKNDKSRHYTHSDTIISFIFTLIRIIDS